MRLRPKLSVKYIRDNFNQVSVFSKFLDIDYDVIVDCINYNSTIYSPLRDDDNLPSVGFAFDKKGRLKMRDFNGTFWGDMFDLVAYIYKFRVSSKNDFYIILKIIYDAMLNDQYRDVISEDIKNRINAIKKEKLVIDLNVRSWNNKDKQFWGQWDLDIDFLNANYVFPIENYWINIDSNPNPKYYYNPNNPCYAYYLGFDSNGIINYRLYFPYKNKYFPKFISNNNVLQGSVNLKDDYDAITITKAYKEVLFFRKLFSTHYSKGGFKIGFIAPPAEDYRFTEHDILDLKGRTKTGDLISFYDFDKTGITGANRLKNKYDIPYLFLTNGRFNSFNYESKDMTDYYVDHGRTESLILIDKVLNLLL